jgi:hypothetical protein
MLDLENGKFVCHLVVAPVGKKKRKYSRIGKE